MIDRLIDNYNNIFIDKEVNKINKLNLGFVSKDKDNDILYCILIHCLENVTIFNQTQINNINECINKLSYE